MFACTSLHLTHLGHNTRPVKQVQ